MQGHMVKQKFNYKTLVADFQSEAACLEYVFDYKYRQRLTKCPTCESDFCYNRVRGKRAYSCKICNARIYPLSTTPLRLSPVPLVFWIFLIYELSMSRTAFTAAHFARHTDVSYRTAARMLLTIFKCFGKRLEEMPKLNGFVEIDEGYFSGRQKYKYKRGRNNDKAVVIAMIERGQPSRVVAKHVPNARYKEAIKPLLDRYVEKSSSLIISDEYQSYQSLPGDGYSHHFVRHKETYVDGFRSTNNCESYFSKAKSLFRAYRKISKDNFQLYIDFLSFVHNFKDSPNHLFYEMLHAVLDHNDEKQEAKEDYTINVE